MKTLITILFLLIIFSCSDNDDEPVCCFVLNNGVKFNILNQQGEDLLNDSTPEYFPVEEMTLYYLINDEKIEAQHMLGGLENDGIGLSTDSNPYYLSCLSNIYDGDLTIDEETGIGTGISITYLQLNNQVTDTIKTEWESKEDKYIVNKKIWYNGELHEPAEIVFEVIK